MNQSTNLLLLNLSKLLKIWHSNLQIQTSRQKPLVRIALQSLIFGQNGVVHANWLGPL